MSVAIEIDGKRLQVEPGTSVLEAALQNGIYIPHLCHHPDLPDIGSCRLCIVEVEGEEGVQPACKLTVKEGMKVITDSPRIAPLRKLAMELLLAAHPEDCSTCPKYGRCELQTLIQYMGVSATRMHTRVKGFAQNNKNPLYIHDMNRCVLCGRCVRACNDLRGVGVLQYNKKELETCVGTLHEMLLKDAGCRFCGACAEVCPTGTIRDIIEYSPIEKKDTLIPCQATCPVHTEVPRYVRYVKEGKYAEALAVVHEKLPFPECLGHVCAHPCEKKCRRGDVNDPVSIRNIKRYAAEHGSDELWKKNSKHLPATGKKVCVVGGGPAGMTAAYYLAKQGHDVTLKEAFPTLGGQMAYGIPSYRLPREVVAKEAGYLTDAGVHVETNCRVTDFVGLAKEYDAVLLALGTHKGVRLPMQGNDLPGVLVNSDFLYNAATGQETGMGKRVIVLGGGNVAVAGARTAERRGAEEIHLACLEAREKMLADEEEITQAQEEGIQIHPAHTFEAIVGTDHAEGVKFCRVKSFTFDENRRAHIEKEENSEYVIGADTVIFATGQRTEITPEAGLELGRANSIAVKQGSLQTSVPGIYACGDAVYGTRTVVEAVGAGRAAASEIDIALGGDGDISEVLAPVEKLDPWIGKVEGFGDKARAEECFLCAKDRSDSFTPISKGIADGEICGEAGRCLQCDLQFQITGHRIWSDYIHEEKEGAQ